MEVIARFPALPDDRAVSGAAAAAEPDPVPDTTPREPGVREARAASSISRRRVQPGVGFPFRSVLVLAVVAVVAWALALKNDAARRQEARLAQAPSGSVPR